MTCQVWGVGISAPNGEESNGKEHELEMETGKI